MRHIPDEELWVDPKPMSGADTLATAQAAYQRGVDFERERCAEVARDWFTLPPRFRTKENLLKSIRNR